MEILFLFCLSFFIRFIQAQNATTFGLIYSMSPCGIIIGFDELYRSEACFIVLWHIFKMLKQIDASNYCLLPKVFIYDNACSLFMYFWNRYGQNDVNRRIMKTSPSNFLSTCEFYIDRFHQANHKNVNCKTKRNIDYQADPAIKTINTQVLEQKHSILKKFTNIFSTYSSRKVHAFYLLLFHLMNAERNQCNQEYEYSRKFAKLSK